VVNGTTTDGSRLYITTCSSSIPTQQWIYAFSSTLRLNGTTKCVDLVDGIITDGTPLQIWECDPNNQNQLWVGAPVPNLRTGPVKLTGGATDSGATSLCMAASKDEDKAEVGLVDCRNVDETFVGGNATWVIPVKPLAGPFETFGGDKCLAVPEGEGEVADGTALEVRSCVEGDARQQWVFKLDSVNQIQWVGSNKCVDVNTQNVVRGTPIQLWDCNIKVHETWFIISP
ncbi:hypothetical protein V5O48_007440, partial [Marasmius crinis-equi]